jgi:predicted dehydrogenase
MPSGHGRAARRPQPVPAAWLLGQVATSEITLRGIRHTAFDDADRLPRHASGPATARPPGRTRAALGGPGHGMDRRTIRPRAADLDDPASRRRRLPHPGLRRTVRRLGGPLTAHGSPEALVADPGIDIVYVATPHQAHRAGALLAIDAGKHVLVEKPLGLDATQAEEVSAAAATAGVLCMEAMWTLFLPRFDVVRQVLEQGLLGDVRTVLADHGERFDPPHRILDPAMAGGSLLDLGSYLTALATWTLGPAQDVYATGEMTPRGVNGQAAMVLTHDGGARSVLHTTLLTRTPTAAVIAGTAATLTLPGPFFMPGDVVLTSADGNRTGPGPSPSPSAMAPCTTPLSRWRCGWRPGNWSRPCARRPKSSPGCGRWTKSAASSECTTTRRAEPSR